MRLFNSRLILWGLCSFLIPPISSVPVAEDLHPQDLQSLQIDQGKTHIPRSLSLNHSLERRDPIEPPRGIFKVGTEFRYKKGQHKYIIYSACEDKKCKDRTCKQYATVILVRKINGGSQGQIWDGQLSYFDSPNARPQSVAVKISPGGSALDQSNIQKLVKSPYVLSYIERFYSRNGQESVILMPKGDRNLLQALSQGWGRGSLAKSRRDHIVRAIFSIGSVLQVARRAHVVHRDIKPQNVLEIDGKFYVIDWDYALYIKPGAGVRDTTDAGSSKYMSPEVLASFTTPGGISYNGFSSDVYSLTRTYLEADQWDEMKEKDFSLALDSQLQKHQGGGLPGLSYESTDDALKKAFPERELSREKRHLMARGLCRQEDRWKIATWMEEFQRVENVQVVN
ncbi:hypothetical protein NUU61_000876 [Penicillium alfredii]|uniref:non-specific serine/threonine protein kinase n=1 Tax=Penicillium alfredii TaxID=1506179 RepID=A0A9W9GBJ0_9EURO|nr:uncharacterized protein NUU61_000876 [Penicillium alfredii]KAJ5115117.1 hypothetical protein NUU61_000876 [Penicillium alfredii]